MFVNNGQRVSYDPTESPMISHVTMKGVSNPSRSDIRKIEETVEIVKTETGIAENGNKR